MHCNVESQQYCMKPFTLHYPLSPSVKDLGPTLTISRRVATASQIVNHNALLMREQQ